jgi:hypothetical protein
MIDPDRLRSRDDRPRGAGQSVFYSPSVAQY